MVPTLPPLALSPRPLPPLSSGAPTARPGALPLRAPTEMRTHPRGEAPHPARPSGRSVPLSGRCAPLRTRAVCLSGVCAHSGERCGGTRAAPASPLRAGKAAPRVPAEGTPGSPASPSSAGLMPRGSQRGCGKVGRGAQLCAPADGAAPAPSLSCPSGRAGMRSAAHRPPPPLSLPRGAAPPPPARPPPPPRPHSAELRACGALALHPLRASPPASIILYIFLLLFFPCAEPCLPSRWM